eukprot:TRINITY_DN22112_c0_g1_i1.p1 TRINITY_DN22112_c0_g1~~TRINITY_DN22112_c0_g1_i1.p1  ORF type:complete len:2066 (-),score=374.45 TRINITY_DN22112_c0_g1_i1:93-5507(-)
MLAEERLFIIAELDAQIRQSAETRLEVLAIDARAHLTNMEVEQVRSAKTIGDTRQSELSTEMQEMKSDLMESNIALSRQLANTDEEGGRRSCGGGVRALLEEQPLNLETKGELVEVFAELNEQRLQGTQTEARIREMDARLHRALEDVNNCCAIEAAGQGRQNELFEEMHDTQWWVAEAIQETRQKLTGLEVSVAEQTEDVYQMEEEIGSVASGVGKSRAFDTEFGELTVCLADQAARASRTFEGLNEVRAEVLAEVNSERHRGSEVSSQVQTLNHAVEGAMAEIRELQREHSAQREMHLERNQEAEDTQCRLACLDAAVAKHSAKADRCEESLQRARSEAHKSRALKSEILELSASTANQLARASRCEDGLSELRSSFVEARRREQAAEHVLHSERTQSTEDTQYRLACLDAAVSQQSKNADCLEEFIERALSEVTSLRPFESEVLEFSTSATNQRARVDKCEEGLVELRDSLFKIGQREQAAEHVLHSERTQAAEDTQCRLACLDAAFYQHLENAENLKDSVQRALSEISTLRPLESEVLEMSASAANQRARADICEEGLVELRASLFEVCQREQAAELVLHSEQTQAAEGTQCRLACLDAGFSQHSENAENLKDSVQRALSEISTLRPLESEVLEMSATAANQRARTDRCEEDLVELRASLFELGQREQAAERVSHNQQTQAAEDTQCRLVRLDSAVAEHTEQVGRCEESLQRAWSEAYSSRALESQVLELSVSVGNQLARADIFEEGLTEFRTSLLERGQEAEARLAIAEVHGGDDQPGDAISRQEMFARIEQIADMSKALVTELVSLESRSTEESSELFWSIAVLKEQVNSELEEQRRLATDIAHVVRSLDGRFSDLTAETEAKVHEHSHSTCEASHKLSSLDAPSSADANDRVSEMRSLEARLGNITKEVQALSEMRTVDGRLNHVAMEAEAKLDKHRHLASEAKSEMRSVDARLNRIATDLETKLDKQRLSHAEAVSEMRSLDARLSEGISEVQESLNKRHHRDCETPSEQQLSRSRSLDEQVDNRASSRIRSLNTSLGNISREMETEFARQQYVAAETTSELRQLDARLSVVQAEFEAKLNDQCEGASARYCESSVPFDETRGQLAKFISTTDAMELAEHDRDMTRSLRVELEELTSSLAEQHEEGNRFAAMLSETQADIGQTDIQVAEQHGLILDVNEQVQRMTSEMAKLFQNCEAGVLADARQNVSHAEASLCSDSVRPLETVANTSDLAIRAESPQRGDQLEANLSCLSPRPRTRSSSGTSSRRFDGQWTRQTSPRVTSCLDKSASEIEPSQEMTEEVREVLLLHFQDAPWPPPLEFESKLRSGLRGLGTACSPELRMVHRDGNIVVEVHGSQDELDELQALPLSNLVIDGLQLGLWWKSWAGSRGGCRPPPAAESLPGRSDLKVGRGLEAGPNPQEEIQQSRPTVRSQGRLQSSRTGESSRGTARGGGRGGRRVRRGILVTAGVDNVPSSTALHIPAQLSSPSVSAIVSDAEAIALVGKDFPSGATYADVPNSLVEEWHEGMAELREALCRTWALESEPAPSTLALGGSGCHISAAAKAATLAAENTCQELIVSFDARLEAAVTDSAEALAAQTVQEARLAALRHDLEAMRGDTSEAVEAYHESTLAVHDMIGLESREAREFTSLELQRHASAVAKYLAELATAEELEGVRYKLAEAIGDGVELRRQVLALCKKQAEPTKGAKEAAAAAEEICDEFRRQLTGLQGRVEHTEVWQWDTLGEMRERCADVAGGLGHVRDEVERLTEKVNAVEQNTSRGIALLQQAIAAVCAERA